LVSAIDGERRRERNRAKGQQTEDRGAGADEKRAGRLAAAGGEEGGTAENHALAGRRNSQGRRRHRHFHFRGQKSRLAFITCNTWRKQKKMSRHAHKNTAAVLSVCIYL